MAEHRYHISANSHLLNGTMRAIGFRTGRDRNKSAGTYARDHNIREEDSIADSALWKKLQGHNNFIANRIQSLSKSAWQQNHEVSINHGVPNWDQETWRQYYKEHNFAGNVTRLASLFPLLIIMN
ncbi:hypothetical protein PCASD_09503 [Puccinia coronata f. sp. avenae]|uniref:Tet-like 2OG-Fe(II) oxygenase domain-containing protein n=1 Tax=Puccinia coronata f. sp. avenae TaxID=200324 RepID=A0A2N5U6D7_9BASI|nr:hypothetical protein PCASD_09503 [Puccinia coronata f. sp. avenae]